MTPKPYLSSDIFKKNAPAVYIHIPFCVSKCAYCDFYSIPCAHTSDMGNTYQKNIADTPHASSAYSGECFSKDVYELQSHYVDFLCKQMALTSSQYSKPDVSTVFIGGGTPSVLKTENMQKIFDTLYRCFNVPKGAEITIEANPETLTPKKLDAYKRMGINRLSIGMQSAVDPELKTLSRIHTLSRVTEALKNSRAAGFKNINLDIMYALPGQTLESFKTTLDAVVSLSPEHISVYGLQLEEGTPLFKNREALSFPGEDAENAMNALALDILEKNGYVRYEISNYARKGLECKHNLNYWLLGEYFGFGVAAHSFKDGKRYSIKKDISAYCSSKDFSDVTETEELLTEESLVEEYIMLSLRLCEGISLKKLRALTENANAYIQRAKPFIKNEFMEIHGITEGDLNEINSEAFLRFTPKGFNVSNIIISEILYG